METKKNQSMKAKCMKCSCSSTKPSLVIKKSINTLCQDQRVKTQCSHVCQDSPFGDDMKENVPTVEQSVKYSTERPQTSDAIRKENKVMRDIVAKNEKYFVEKTKVCCSVKPVDIKLQLPSSTGHTVYKHEFTKKGVDNPSVKVERFQPYRPSYPFMNPSNYQTNYVAHPLAASQAENKQTPVKDDAPRFLQSMYRGDFKNWGGKSPNMKILPQQNNILGSGRFDGKTVYRNEFNQKPSSPMLFSGPLRDPSSKNLFLNMNMPNESNYRKQFTKKDVCPEKNMKPKYAFVPSVTNPDFYNSEYKTMFDPKEHDHCHYRKVLSVQELQDMFTKK